MNNIVEQDHCAIKRRVNACLGFRSFDGAQRTIQGYEASVSPPDATATSKPLLARSWPGYLQQIRFRCIPDRLKSVPVSHVTGRSGGATLHVLIRLFLEHLNRSNGNTLSVRALQCIRHSRSSRNY
ncbi:MAG: DDE-type integrase/transposase/recombinase [Bryobacteraceae bacterium]